MTACPKCGAQSDDKFCPRCGAPVQPYPQQLYPQQPYPGVCPGSVQPQKQGSSWWKWVLGIVGGLFGLLILLIVLASLVADEPATPPVTQQTAVAVGVITITDKVNNSSMEPLNPHMNTVPAATKTIYAAAQVTARQGQHLSANWYFNGQHLTDIVAEIPIERDISQTWAAFNLSRNDGKTWPAGPYKAILYLDGKAVRQVEFTVK